MRTDAAYGAENAARREYLCHTELDSLLKAREVIVIRQKAIFGLGPYMRQVLGMKKVH